MFQHGTKYKCFNMGLDTNVSTWDLINTNVSTWDLILNVST